MVFAGSREEGFVVRKGPTQYVDSDTQNHIKPILSRQCLEL